MKISRGYFGDLRPVCANEMLAKCRTKTTLSVIQSIAVPGIKISVIASSSDLLGLRVVHRYADFRLGLSNPRNC